MFGLNMIVNKGKTVFIGDTSVHEYPTSEQLWLKWQFHLQGWLDFLVLIQKLLLYLTQLLGNQLQVELNILEMLLKYLNKKS